MNQSTNIHFRKYKKLVEEIEKETGLLEKFHLKHMHCKKGCDLCCIDFSIFPIEFHYILHNIRGKNIDLEVHTDENICKFLNYHSCTIYSYRPVMCRTHGFPLIYTSEEGEPELSVCHLNFTDFDFADFTFENTIPQDKFNSKLFLLNKEFIKEFKEKKYGEFDLIPLKEITNYLQ